MINFVRNNISTLSFALSTTMMSAGAGHVVDSVIANEAKQHMITAQVCDEALEGYQKDGVAFNDLTPPPSRKHSKAQDAIIAAHENFDSKNESHMFRNLFTAMALLTSGTSLLGAKLDSKKRNTPINSQELKLKEEFSKGENQGIERTLLSLQEAAAHLGIKLDQELAGCDQSQLGPEDFIRALKANVMNKALEPSDN